MTVYGIAQIQIADRADYAKYEAGFAALFSKHNGKMLAVDEKTTVLEGKWPFSRTVIIEFPDVKSAQAFVDSDEYAPVKPIRQNNAECTLFIVDAG